jgi:hypothetical protein
LPLAFVFLEFLAVSKPWTHGFRQLGESHPRVAAGIKKNAMTVENFGNLARLIIRENFGDLGNLVASVGNSLI